MRLWILVGCGVVILAAAIWPVSSPKPPATPPAAPAVQTPPAESPKPAPAKVVEVIDLSRTYEPVREPEEPAGTVNPASLIQVPDGPRRIPPAATDLDDQPFLLGAGIVTGDPTVRRADPIAPFERIDVMPRDLSSIQSGLLNFVPSAEHSAGKIFTPMGVPFVTGITQPIPPNASIQNGLLNFTPTAPRPPVERLDVMPRVLTARFVIEEPDGTFVRYVEIMNGAALIPEENSLPSGVAQPVPLIPERNSLSSGITQPIPRGAFVSPLIPLEEVKVMPREVSAEPGRRYCGQPTVLEYDRVKGAIGP